MADDVVLCREDREELEVSLERWREVLDERETSFFSTNAVMNFKNTMITKTLQDDNAGSMESIAALLLLHKRKMLTYINTEHTSKRNYYKPNY